MLKRPNLRDPSDVKDIFTVLLVVVIIISIFSVVIENDSFRDIIIIFSIIVFGWVAWAVHNILVKHTDEQDEMFQ